MVDIGFNEKYLQCIFFPLLFPASTIKCFFDAVFGVVWCCAVSCAVVQLVVHFLWHFLCAFWCSFLCSFWESKLMRLFEGKDVIKVQIIKCGLGWFQQCNIGERLYNNGENLLFWRLKITKFLRKIYQLKCGKISQKDQHQRIQKKTKSFCSITSKLP